MDDVSKVPAFRVVEQRQYPGISFVKISHKKFEENFSYGVSEDTVDPKLSEKFFAKKANQTVIE